MTHLWPRLLLPFVTFATFALAEPDKISELRKKADAGDRIAQTFLGAMYESGKGLPKDSAEAARWYRRAAEQGQPDAQCFLGILYENGNGVPKDCAEAIKWYRRATEQGEADAQFYLGMMYAKGNGVPKDLVQAHVWWNIAGAKDVEEAKKNLAIIESRMTADQKAEAMKLARELFEKLPKN